MCIKARCVLSRVRQSIVVALNAKSKKKSSIENQKNAYNKYMAVQK